MTDTEKVEYESVIQKLTTALEQLAAENARLRAEKSDALSFLKEVYNDPSVSPALRVKSAGLCLPHEVPRLTSVPPPLDLVAEPIEPLAQLVERQRRRADAILSLPLAQRAALITGVGRDDGNGSDSSGD